MGYMRLLSFTVNLNANFFFFFKAKKNEQKPESFCLSNSSGISRWEAPDLLLCLFTFLITITMTHKHQFCIFETKMTALIASVTVVGERHHCPRSQSCLERNR